MWNPVVTQTSQLERVRFIFIVVGYRRCNIQGDQEAHPEGEVHQHHQWSIDYPWCIIPQFKNNNSKKVLARSIWISATPYSNASSTKMDLKFFKIYFNILRNGTASESPKTRGAWTSTLKVCRSAIFGTTFSKGHAFSARFNIPTQSISWSVRVILLKYIIYTINIQVL